MEQETVIKKSIKMFNEPEKWFAFLELVKMKDRIVGAMNKHLREEMDKYFHEKTFTGFKFQFQDSTLNNCNAFWYLEEVGHGICLFFTDSNMSLYIDENIYQNTEGINNILQNKENAVVLHSLFRFDRCESKWWKIVEKGNWYFKKPSEYSEYNGTFDKDSLSWYSYNATEELIQQLFNKVEKFCTNDQMKKIILEIHLIGKQSKK